MPSDIRKPWSERIRHFTPAWWTVIMGTGVLSVLAHSFPYGGPQNTILRMLFMFFFMLNLLFFMLVSGCTIARYVMFPEVWSAMLRHPAQSMFLGAFPMGCATLINAALIANQEWGWGGHGFLYTLWALWWLDSIVSFIIAFGMIYIMMVRQDHSLAKMTPVWLLPIVTVIVASSTGGSLAAPLVTHHPTIAILTAGLSFTMVLIGLGLALMMITIYLLRLIVYGPPDISLALSAFVVLGPLGQGGYALLVGGENVALLFPAVVGARQMPASPLVGQMVYTVAFCAAYALFSIGICWAVIAVISIGNQLRKGRIPFALSHWGLVFPNGVFARLCCELASILNSPFFRVLAAFWCILTFGFWLLAFVPSIPAVINGSIFKAPCLTSLDAMLPLAMLEERNAPAAPAAPTGPPTNTRDPKHA